MTWLRAVWASSLMATLLAFIFYIPLFALDSSKPVEAAFLHDSGSDKALVFFGFSHCADVCPTSLAVLRTLIQDKDELSKWPQVAFIDIDANSNQLNAQNYAQMFHSSFIGYHASETALSRLRADFGLNIRQRDDQIIHQGRTYLLNRKQAQWYIVKTYNPGTFDAHTLAAELY